MGEGRIMQEQLSRATQDAKAERAPTLSNSLLRFRCICSIQQYSHYLLFIGTKIKMLQYDVVVVTPLQENCSLIWCDATNKAALIDPGGDTDKILAFLEGKDVELERILITHTHFDHVGAAADLAEKFNIPIEGSHADDEFLVEALPHQGAMFGYPAVRPYTPDRYFQQGDKIQIGETELNVHHCPGHTPGHIAFSNQEAKIAFVGDVIFQGSVGRTDFERGDPHALIRSIKQQLLPLGDDFSFVPGHGPNSTFGQERLTNPFIR